MRRLLPSRRPWPSAPRSRGGALKARNVSLAPRAVREVGLAACARRAAGSPRPSRRGRARGRCAASGAEAAADVDVDSPRPCRSSSVDRHAAPMQADVADVVLGAGVVAAGEVDVDRRVERHARLDTSRRSPSAVPLVSAAANLQPALPVQATRPARMLVASESRPSASMRALRRGRRRSSAMPEISRFCQTVRRMSPPPSSRAISARPRICVDGHAADRQHDADLDQARLLLRVDADMRLPVAARSRRRHLSAGEPRAAGAPSFASTSARNLSKPQAIEHVFQPRLLAVGAVAVVDEDAHDGGGHGDALLRLDAARRCRGRSPGGR